MSCGCNTNPCSCPPACCTPTTESVTYAFENANMAGIGVFDNDTDYLVQFRGLVSDAAALTITLNAADNTLVFDFDGDALIADIPSASTSQRGILETATNGEALAKAATDKILVPSNLAALGSTTSFAGLVELATSAETITGTSTTLAVTPAGLAAAGALYGTVTFADAAARGGATPAFAGQFGGQVDTEQGFIGGSTSAGDWNGVFTFGGTSLMTGGTSLNLNGSALSFTGGSFNIDGTTTNTWAGNYVFANATVMLDAVSTLDIGMDTVLKFDGVLQADVLIGTDGAGAIELYDANTFMGPNVQTGYTTFTNPATLRTCNTATVTLQQLAQIVGTLIEDLKIPLKPAT